MDRSDIGAVVDAMYAMISGPAGPRDWSLQVEVFHRDSRQIRTGVGPDGKPWMKIMGREDYIGDTTPYFMTNDFHEIEIARRVDVLGNIAHVWSAYEARRSPDDAEPERRGVNSIQLFRDGNGQWSIVAMIWDNERPGVSVQPF
jgi:hypothetical protein